MKRVLIAAMAACLVMSCTSKQESGYVGQSDIRIEDGIMTAETLLSFGRLSDPQLSPDGQKILYGVSYTSIGDNRSCRNLFLCNTDGSGKVQLTRYAKSVSNARWSLDGKSIWFIQDGQIWNAPLNGNKLGKKVQVSDVKAGISEFKLSPDQCNLIYVSTIPGSVKTPKDINPALDKAQAYIAEDLMYRHWDHWVTEIPHSFIAPVNGDKITEVNSFDILGEEGAAFELPTEPFGGLEQIDWAPDSRHLAYSCRKKAGKQYAFSTDSEIYIYDIVTGATTELTMGGGYDTDPVWSPDGSHLAWISMARDGYEADQQRLMAADVTFGTTDEGQSSEVNVCNVRELTKEFDHDAAGIFWHGEDIYFNALVSEGIQGIFKADLEGNIERITPADWWYDFFSPWAIIESEGKTELLASYYCLNFPTELVKVTINNGQPSFEQITDENGHILSQLAEIKQESRIIPTVDGKEMQAWVLFPPQFDSSKTYPAIEICLGGPQGTNSQDWSYRWCYRLMASQGYVVILPNRRGTTAFGQEWKEQISGDYDGLNMQDYLCAAKAIKSEPYVSKLAAVGASYGGYSVYNLAGMHGDTYDCFIAHAGIFDEKDLWFTTEEMWFANWDNGGLTEYAYEPGQMGPGGDGITFGGMQQAGAPYSNTPKANYHYSHAPSTKITNWHTPILCIHGGMDFRIPYTQGMAAFNAAQMMGVPSKLVIFPDENHWILQPQNSLLWHEVFYEWLEKWIK